MPISINYLSLKNQENIKIGEIEFFDSYKITSSSFPYFYLGQKSVTLAHQNWPDLVPYLYEQKATVIDLNKTVYNTFPIYSFSNTNGIATFNFTNVNVLKILNALIEDKNMYFVDNDNNYSGWGKTITPKTDIAINGTTFFIANNNYYINDIVTQQNSGYLTVSSGSSIIVNNSLLTDKNIEFGLYRIPGKSNIESVYYTMNKGKFFSNNNTNDSLSGLKIRSQILGHAHDHNHNLNNHTHIMQHSHGLNNHTHVMQHSHNYVDLKSNVNQIFVGIDYSKVVSGSYTFSDKYIETSSSREFTDGPNNNITSVNSNNVTNSISTVITSNINTKTTNDDDDIYSNNYNFKVNNKIIPESYTIYCYIYGGKYIST
jgi:hypothetical protein